MKKFFMLLVLATTAVVASGCAMKGPVNGPQRRVVMLQVGVIVHVVNNCAPLIDLEHDGRVEIKDLPYGESAVVPIVSSPFSGRSPRLFLTAKGFTEKKEYLGSATKSYTMHFSRGTQHEVWEVDRLNLPGRRGGCQ